MSSRVIVFLIAVTASWTVFLGCGDLFDGLDLEPWDHLSCAGSSTDLTGTWTISGEGTRSNCRDEFLNTDRLSLGSIGLLLEHDITSNKLTLGPGLPETFTLRAGNVDGRCVDFTTQEQVGAQIIEYRWEGESASADRIKGEFTGLGPVGCSATGIFEMTRD